MSERSASDTSSAAELRRSLIEDLLITHLQQPSEEGIDDAEIVAQHPDLMPELAEQLQLFREIADQRVANDAMDTADTDAGASTVRCPHCRERILVSTLETLSDVTCSGCGSCFRLAEDTTKAAAAVQVKKVDQFELVEKIGFGTFGIVWRARDTELERWVAIKVPRRGKLNAKEVEQFKREARAAARLSHPNIVSVYGVGWDDETLYIVSDFVDGVSLSEVLAEQPPTIEESCELCATVAEALQHAHDAGVIHRDLKPQNIMLDADGNPHLLDFGLARQSASEVTMTLDGHVLGTPAYMPPEQARGEANQVGRQADIYSLGVVLFQLLTGELPFRGNTRMLLHQVLHEDAPSPRRLNNRISKDLETICLKCLQKKPEARYQTAKAVADELDRYLTNRPILARPVSRLSRLLSAAQRNKVITGLVLVVSSLLVGIAVVSSISTIAFSRKNKELNAEKSNAVTDRAKAEYSQYTSNMQAADSFLRGNDTLLARKVVENAPPEHRNFEWALLANQAWPNRIGDFTVSGTEKLTASEIWNRGRLELLREILPWDASGGTQGGFFSSQGDSVFVYLTNGDVRQFSIGSGKHTATYSTPVGHSIAVALSSDGSRLGAISFSSRGTVWDIDSQSIVAIRGESLESASSPWICRWTPDNKYLVSGHMKGTVRIWDGGSLALLATCEGHKENVFELSISPSSDAVWSASTDGSIRGWSLPEGTPQGEFRVPIPGDLEVQAISPSGELAFALYRDGSQLIWEIKTEQVVNKLSGPTAHPYKGQPRFAAAFSPDERLLAVAVTNRSITVYDRETGRTLHEFQVPLAALRTLTFSPDGTQLLAVTEGGKAKIFGCVIRSSPELSDAHTDVIYQIDVADSGDLMLAGSFDGTASLWNLRNQEQVSRYDSHDAEIVAVDLSRDGTRAATLDATGTLHVWDAIRSETIFVTRPHSDEFSKHIGRAGGGLRGNVLNYTAVLSTGIFSPDGTRLVAYHQGTMTVLDARTGKVEAILEGATSSGWPIYSHDSSLVSVLEMNTRVANVWNLETGKRVTQLEGHRNHLVMMDFSPVDHTVVTAAMGSKIIVWNAQTGREIRCLDEKGGDCTCCRFSPDGHYILAGYTDSAVRVWSAQSGELVTTLLGHSIRIRDVRLSPDKTRILTCAMDDKAMIWDFSRPLANQLAVVEGDSKLLQAHWAPEGRSIITAWSDGGIRFWRGATKQDLEQFKQGNQPFEQGFESWRDRFMRMESNSNR